MQFMLNIWMILQNPATVFSLYSKHGKYARNICVNESDIRKIRGITSLCAELQQKIMQPAYICQIFRVCEQSAGFSENMENMNAIFAHPG